MMMGDYSGAGLILVRTHIAFLGLELGFDVLSGTVHVSRGFQGSVLRGVGQVVAGFDDVQIPEIDCPMDSEQRPRDDYGTWQYGVN